MDNEIKYIGLYLDAPLQSWGYQSKFDRRTTLSYPTRSGVVGMLSAAMGIQRDGREELEELATLGIQVVVYRQEGRLTDFHTVGGGWSKKENPGNIVLRASGKPGDTVVTYREYLESARFGVVLSAEADLIGRAADALKHPVWGVWLGRKACIPASSVFQGVFDSYESTLDALARVAVAEGRAHVPDRAIRVVQEVDRFEDGTDTLMDVPLDFAERRFAPRRVCVNVAEGD